MSKASPKGRRVVFCAIYQLSGHPFGNTPGEVVESSSPFEHMDKSTNPKPSTLRCWQSKFKAPPALTPEVKASQSTDETSKVLPRKGHLIGFLCFLGLMFALSNWKQIFLTVGFLGTWTFIAFLGLRAKKSKILAIGGGLILTTLSFVGLDLLFGKHPSGQSDFAEATSAPNSNSIENKWLELDTATRKSLVESKMHEAQDLQREMEAYLEAANNMRLTAEMYGRIQTWKSSIPSVLREIDESGFKPEVQFDLTAMNNVHSALTYMLSAWDDFEKFDAARTPDERSRYASRHANNLKLMRENFSYAKTLIESGKY